MGKQVNFYLLPADIAILEEKIRDIDSLVVLHSRSNISKPRELANLELLEEGQHWLYFYLVRPEDLDSVQMRHVPAQNYWTVDVLKSPVIELQRCFWDGQVLRRGRVYYQDKFFGDDNELIEKSESFQRWAKWIFKTIKQSLDKVDHDYLGYNAKRWLSTGGTFIQ